jgi:hypothetical protein
MVNCFSIEIKLTQQSAVGIVTKFRQIPGSLHPFGHSAIVFNGTGLWRKYGIDSSFPFARLSTK